MTWNRTMTFDGYFWHIEMAIKIKEAKISPADPIKLTNTISKSKTAYKSKLHCGSEETQPTHDSRTTLIRRRFNFLTSY